VSAVSRVLLALVIAASLAACAKKAPPLPPAGVRDTYPRTYPPAAPGELIEPQDESQ
jgi:hypothetical protein